MRVPSRVCCGRVALQRARLRAFACKDRLLSPCHNPPVSSLLPRKCLVGLTKAPSQLQAAPTPRRCDGSKDKKTNQTSVLNFCHFGRYGSHFFCAQGCPKAGKKECKKSKSNSIVLWSHNSVGYKVRSSRPSSGRFQASPHARDDVDRTETPWQTPSCNSLGSHLQQQKKHHEQTLTLPVLENVHMQRG